MRFIKFATFGLAIAAILTQPSDAEGVSTMGQIDCGQWIAARSQGRSTADEKFVVGFLDGFSLGHFVEFWNASGGPISPDAVFLWLDNYCKANPLDNLHHATILLYMERSGWKG